MSQAGTSHAVDGSRHGDIPALIPIIRRVVGARVADSAEAEDLVQETLARVLAAGSRVEPGMLEPYAIVTARNLVASLRKRQDSNRRNQHRIADIDSEGSSDEGLLQREEHTAIAEALRRLSDRERQVLLAHEVSGRDTRTLGDQLNLSASAVAAQLHRARARMRVEFLLALEQTEPPTDRCRPVLLALSISDKRRQRELDAARHLLECQLCARLSEPLLERARDDDGSIVRIPIHRDADIVAARQAARELAARLGFSRTDLTAIATAVSEVTRNIVRFTDGGEIRIELIEEPRPGVQVVARDTGPGIADVEQALCDGYSTYNGLGLGLPGARRLMDELTLVSEVDRGTTVTMIKWRKER
jgi:RNA polymerase sigma factor (sigma-70 family)